MKQLGRTRVRVRANKAIHEKEPDTAMARLVELSLKASVPDPGKGVLAALPMLQQNHQRVVDAWNASPSEKHRKEMVRLFKHELG